MCNKRKVIKGTKSEVKDIMEGKEYRCRTDSKHNNQNTERKTINKEQPEIRPLYVMKRR